MAKGITPIIAIIILLLITVAIAGMGWSYINMYTGGLTNNVVEVTSATCANGVANVIMRNSGTGTMDTAQVRVMNSTSGADITSAVTWSSGISSAGKVMELRFDQAGSPQKDTSGNGNDGTVNGATWTAAGKVGGAYSFDGANDYIDTNDFSWPSSSSFAISAWAKPADATTSTFIGKPNPTWEYSLIKYGTGSASFIYWNPSGGNALLVPYYANASATGTWTHMVVTYGNNIVKIYINGQLANSTSVISTPFRDNSANMQVGAGYNGIQSYFNGIIDEVGIWNRELSAPEIADMAANSVDVQPGGMASFTNSCGAGSRCSYNIISGGRTQQAYVQC